MADGRHPAARSNGELRMKRDEAPLVSLAIQPISRDVLKEKYLKPGENDLEELFERVARALASVETEAKRDHWKALFHTNLRAGAIGAGRIMSADGYPGIYEALREAAETMRRGGGVGYDFSRIRPRGAEVSATASIASGPCS